MKRIKRYAIYGTGGAARSVMPLAREQLAALNEPYELAFVEDNPLSSICNGYPVWLYTEWLAQPSSGCYISILINDGSIREELVRRCQADGVGFYEVRANTVVQSDEVDLGEGAMLAHFVSLGSNARIGRHFHAHSFSYVGHDCVIGDFVTFAPDVKCNGNIVIEDYAYIGAGAVLKQGKPGKPLVIGQGATVGMGAVVTKSVPPGATVVGNPARPLVKKIS